MASSAGGVGGVGGSAPANSLAGSAAVSASGGTKPSLLWGHNALAVTGNGISYEPTNDGACSFTEKPSDEAVASVSSDFWEDSLACGTCLEVSASKGTVIVRIVDRCSECETNYIGLTRSSLAKISDTPTDPITITATAVACHVTGPIRYTYAENSDEHWTALLVENYALPITKLEVSRNGRPFESVPRNDYNYFIAQSGFGPDPVTVRVTAIDGQILQDVLPAVKELLVTEGKSQFHTL